MTQAASQTPRGQGAPGSRPGASLGDWLVRAIRWGTIAAFAISILVHGAGWVASRYIRLGGGGETGGGAPAGVVEMALMTQGELDALTADAGLDLSTPAVPEIDLQAPDLPDLMSSTLGGDLGEGEALGNVGSGGGAGDVGGEGLGGLGTGGGSGGGARFFGVEAQGNRFAYVVDVSTSMEGPRIASLRQELRQSVERLLDSSQFIVCLFSTDASLLGGRGTWTDASAAGKKWGASQIDLINANGGTNPLPGFKIIFGTRPRPDAIYFMTDGEFDPRVVDEIAVMNRQLRIPIHCICFGSEDGEKLMRQIARQSKGTYTFVPGP